MSYQPYAYPPGRAFAYLSQPSVAAAGRGGSWKVALFWAAHVPLAVLLYRLPTLAAAHAVAVVALGVWWAATSRELERVAYVCAYVAGAEVLWRMSKTPIFWEFGKYAVATILLVAILRARLFKIPAWPVLFFALLLPSSVLTVMNNDPSEARGAISFYYSGPFALMLSSVFFSQVKLTSDQLQRLLQSLIAPTIGIGFVAALGLLTKVDIAFTNDSNRAASGGFGPNQVSSVLGMGAFIALFYVLNDRPGRWFKILAGAVVLYLAAQSAMTFSRNGLYCAVGASAVACFFLARDRRARVNLFLVGALLVCLSSFVVWPFLNKFTGGALETRFEETNSSGREDLIRIDLEIWADNPVLGVGPGDARDTREVLYGSASAAHTEFTRLLSEHGFLGLASLLLLCLTGIVNVVQARTVKGRALAASVITWSFLYMLVNAMRLVAPAFLFGLSFVAISPGAEAASGGTRPAGRKHGLSNLQPRRPKGGGRVAAILPARNFAPRPK